MNHKILTKYTLKRTKLCSFLPKFSNQHILYLITFSKTISLKIMLKSALKGNKLVCNFSKVFNEKHDIYYTSVFHQ